MTGSRRDPTEVARPRPQAFEALDLARQWENLPGKHLGLALKSLEVEAASAREHEYRMKKLQQTHQLYMVGLAAGLAVAIGMLTGAIVLGLNHQAWLAGLFAGPSLLALVTVFVLRKVDSTQAKAVDRAFDPATQGIATGS